MLVSINKFMSGIKKITNKKYKNWRILWGACSPKTGQKQGEFHTFYLHQLTNQNGIIQHKMLNFFILRTYDNKKLLDKLLISQSKHMVKWNVVVSRYSWSAQPDCDLYKKVYKPVHNVQHCSCVHNVLYIQTSTHNV